MKHYLDAGNQDRLYDDAGDCFDLLDEDFDYDKASSRVLGRDLGRLLTKESRRYIQEWMRTVSENTEEHANELGVR